MKSENRISTTDHSSSADKTVWMYWEQDEHGLKHLQDSEIQSNEFHNKMCIEGWRSLNPGWNIRVLNHESALSLVPELSDYGDLSIAMRSDVLRLYLLARYAGVWSDASALPLRPLDGWLSQLVKPTGFFTYRYNPEFEGRIAVSWFLSVNGPTHPLIEKWLAQFLERIEVHRSDGTPLPYFLCHYALTELYHQDKAIRQSLDALGLTQQGPHNGMVPDWQVAQETRKNWLPSAMPTGLSDTDTAMYKRNKNIRYADYRAYLDRILQEDRSA